MQKSPEAFRTIGEVASWLGVPPHVLRFWESKFAQVKPVKRAGGRRYYRRGDMALLGGIKVLLHDRGMTIKGVQRILSEDGPRAVSAHAPELEPDEVASAAETPRDGPDESRVPVVRHGSDGADERAMKTLSATAGAVERRDGRSPVILRGAEPGPRPAGSDAGESSAETLHDADAQDAAGADEAPSEREGAAATSARESGPDEVEARDRERPAGDGPLAADEGGAALAPVEVERLDGDAAPPGASHPDLFDALRKGARSLIPVDDEVPAAPEAASAESDASRTMPPNQPATASDADPSRSALGDDSPSGSESVSAAEANNGSHQGLRAEGQQAQDAPGDDGDSAAIGSDAQRRSGSPDDDREAPAIASATSAEPDPSRGDPEDGLAAGSGEPSDTEAGDGLRAGGGSAGRQAGEPSGDEGEADAVDLDAGDRPVSAGDGFDALENTAERSHGAPTAAVRFDAEPGPDRSSPPQPAGEADGDAAPEAEPAREEGDAHPTPAPEAGEAASGAAARSGRNRLVARRPRPHADAVRRNRDAVLALVLRLEAVRDGMDP